MPPNTFKLFTCLKCNKYIDPMGDEYLETEKAIYLDINETYIKSYDFL